MPSMRPRVSSNSWGYDASSFNCSSVEYFHVEVQNWVAAGIFPSFSSGNAGTTGNRPPSAYPETFETGNITNSGLISSSSSRGPSCYDGGSTPRWWRAAQTYARLTVREIQGTNCCQARRWHSLRRQGR